MRDRCPRWFCKGTLYVESCTTAFWEASCAKCGRVARLDDEFRVRPWLVGLGFVAWFLLVLWLPEAVS